MGKRSQYLLGLGDVRQQNTMKIHKIKKNPNARIKINDTSVFQDAQSVKLSNHRVINSCFLLAKRQFKDSISLDPDHHSI